MAANRAMLRIWVDNTGFHAAGRCLTRHGCGRDDALGLLQVATQLIFADSIHISGYEAESVRTLTDRTRIAFERAGLPPHVIRIESISQVGFADACSAAAIEFGSEAGLLEFDHTPATPLPPPASVICDPRWDDSLHDTLKGSPRAIHAHSVALQTADATHAPLAILSANDDLWQAACGLAKSPGWTARESNILSCHLRVRLNEQYAHVHRAVYSPAVQRGALVRHNCSVMLSAIDGEVSRAAGAVFPLPVGPTENDARRTLLPQSVGTPSIWRGMVALSNSDPTRMLAMLPEWRDRAGPLRKVLQEAVVPADERNQAALVREIRELGLALRQHLGAESAPRLVEAIELQGLIPTVLGGPLSRWTQYIARRRHIGILTELSNAAAFSHQPDLELRRFVARCCSNVGKLPSPFAE